MKDITARVGNYQKDGQTKGEFVKIGALGVSQAGKEYIILDPGVNLAGVLMKQNLMSALEGKPANKSVMCSVFERQQYQPAPVQQNYQQPAQQQTAVPQQYAQPHQQQAPAQQQPVIDNEDIPF